MKLNLGCGKDYREGYINIDTRKPEDGVRVDLIADVSNLPYNSGTVDEILANDILEHFSYRETERVLKEWVRTLRPGGTISIMTPNLNRICKSYLNGEHDSKRTIALLFGGQDYRGNTHYACFDKSIVQELFKKCGLSIIGYGEALNNIIVTGKKLEEL